MLAESPVPGVDLVREARGDRLGDWWLLAPCLREGLVLGVGDGEGLGLADGEGLGLADGVVDVGAVAAVDVAE